jgi:hypothetical protein
MVRFSSIVIVLIMTTTLAGCKTDSQLLNERARAYVAANPSLDRETAAAIAANRVIRGMNKEQVAAAWGEPVIVQRFGKNKELWYFDCVWPHFCNGGSRDEAPEEQYESRAYFIDGKLVDWRD